jgi:hypothetical protein
MARLLWSQRQDVGPRPRVRHAIAYDSARQRTVLFGGDSLGGTLFGDTWEWDGAFWVQLEDTGPAPRSGHVLAYDSARGRVVLYGGAVPALRGDTWEWDGQAWTQIEDTGPEARQGHGLAFDASRSRTVLFGGEAAGPALRGDTWEWDGQAWTQVQDTGPPVRTSHAIAYDSAQQRVIVYGGDTGGATNAGDTWAWDGSTWTEIEDIGPGPLADSAAAATAATVLLFGGMAGDPAAVSGLTWEWDGSHWTLRQDIGPVARWGHAATFDVNRARPVVFGGASVAPTDASVADHVLGDTWEATDDGAGQPQQPPQNVPVTLTSFTITPDTISSGAGGTVTFEVGIDQPAPAPVNVQVSLEGSPFATIPVAQGQATGQFQLQLQSGVPVGAYQFDAELNGFTISAVLTIT